MQPRRSCAARSGTYRTRILTHPYASRRGSGSPRTCGTGTLALWLLFLSVSAVGCRCSRAHVSKARPSKPSSGSAKARPLAEIKPFRPHLGVGATRICVLNSAKHVQCWGSASDSPSGFEKAERVPSEPEQRFDYIAVSGTHVCAVSVGHGVWCAGSNASGALGFRSQDKCVIGPFPGGDVEYEKCSKTLRKTAAPEAVDAMAVGYNRTCVASKALTCWGLRTMADGSWKVSPSSWTVPIVRNVRKMVMGYDFSCVLESGGEVLCWGKNSFGEMALGSVDQVVHQNPQRVRLPGVARDISAGSRHACALVGGDVWCWGSNLNAALGGACTDKVCATPVKVTLPLADAIDSVALGGTTSCVLTKRGRTLCWGDNGYWGTSQNGWLGIPDSDKGSANTTAPICEKACLQKPRRLPVPRFRELDLGNERACGVTLKGKVYCWGYASVRGALGVSTGAKCEAGGCIEPAAVVPGVQM